MRLSEKAIITTLTLLMACAPTISHKAPAQDLKDNSSVTHQGPVKSGQESTPAAPAAPSSNHPSQPSPFPELSAEEKNLLLPRNQQTGAQGTCTPATTYQQPTWQGFNVKPAPSLMPPAPAPTSSSSSVLQPPKPVTNSQLWNSFYPASRKLIQVGRTSSFSPNPH